MKVIKIAFQQYELLISLLYFSVGFVIGKTAKAKVWVLVLIPPLLIRGTEMLSPLLLNTQIRVSSFSFFVLFVAVFSSLFGALAATYRKGG